MTHNSKADGETGVCWTMIATSSLHRDSVIDALRNGRMYGVSGKHGVNQNSLVGVETHGLSCSIICEKFADSIIFIGQNGRIRRKVYQSPSAVYEFTANDTYIRAMIYTKEHTMWLNPILRVKNSGLHPLHATENVLLTWLWRLGWCLGLLVFTTITSNYVRKKD